MITREEVVQILATKRAAVVLASTGSFLVGAVGGYSFAKRRLEAVYSAQADADLEEAKEFYSKLYKTEEFSDPEELAKKYAETPVTQDARDFVEALKSYQDHDPEKVLGQPTDEGGVNVVMADGRVITNIFEGAEEIFNYDEEVAQRTGDAPYIITNEEFHNNESEFEQSTITYFAGDGVLVDERDETINDETIVGEMNLMRFGYGSGDKNVVYVRNEKLEGEWEILRSEGKYTKEVLGIDDEEDGELRHSIRRFRPED